MVTTMSVPQRPAKRLRSGSGAKPIQQPPRFAQPPPLLLRNVEPEVAIIKCLEAIANQRILSASDLIDRLITDNFLHHHEAQIQNKTNIKETKKYLISHLGPILYELITPYVASAMDKRDSSTENDNTAVNTTTESNLTLNTNLPPVQTHVAPQMTISAGGQAQPTIHSWMEQDSAFPLRMNDLGSPQVPYESAHPAKRLSSGGFAVPGAVRTKSEAGVGENTISPARLLPSSPRAQSVSGNFNDGMDTMGSNPTRSRARSVVSRKCTFCDKNLPSPSAKKEHEAVHIESLCQWKQYQCKSCSYRSTRPREVQNHMKLKHNWDPKKRKLFTDQDIIDHGPLSEEKMAELRLKYHEEKTDSVNLTQASFLSGSNVKAPDRDGQTDRDELASQHPTIISMEYSYTAQTPIHPGASQQVSSSINNMFSAGSHFDDTHSFFIRDTMDQSSQAEYQIPEYAHVRNPLNFVPQSFLPSGTQLIGVGAAHAPHPDIQPTLVLEEDAQGENEDWQANNLQAILKGDRA